MGELCTYTTLIWVAFAGALAAHRSSYLVLVQRSRPRPPRRRSIPPPHPPPPSIRSSISPTPLWPALCTSLPPQPRLRLLSRLRLSVPARAPTVPFSTRAAPSSMYRLVCSPGRPCANARLLETHLASAAMGSGYHATISKDR
ncbi:hypothetical protein GY45DRAFT_18156 [Cubamyces sp. BRFM 1775]|nr:hypothetical protein GY45DRAFT_18156 [Cubamyces sp. BRFM 1775]